MKPIQTRTVEVTKTETLTIGLDMATVAAWFCELNDEAQADFFIEVARIAKSWPGYQGQQWHLVGRHLAQCECSTTEARDLVNELHGGLAQP